MFPSGSRIGFGHGGFGTKPASQYIRNRDIHLDTDCLDTLKSSATSVTDFFLLSISRTACIFIVIYLSHWNLGHIGEKDYMIYRLTPIFLLSYPIYLDISIEEDVNLIAAIVTKNIKSLSKLKGILYCIYLMVDHTGFEPVTPCMSSKCSNRAELMIHRISSPLEGPVVDRGRATEGSPASGTSRIFHLIFHFDPKSHMVPETGIEPVTLSLEGSCSIQLSYSGIIILNL